MSQEGVRPRSTFMEPLQEIIHAREAAGPVAPSSALSWLDATSSSPFAIAGPDSDDHDATSRATMVPTRLYSFIRRDIQPQGHRVLLPFITTKGRLSLSECCKGLFKYRSLLSRVKVIPQESDRSGLARLLLSQQPQSLQYLHIDYLDVIGVLDLTSRGCFEGLKTLDLSETDMGEDETVCIERAISSGGLKSLEELNLSENGFIGVGLKRVVEALGSSEAACPRLRRIDFSETVNPVGFEQDEDAIGQSLARVLESGHLSYLEELILPYSNLDRNGLAAIAAALQGGACLQLTKLHLAGCFLDRVDGQALGMALRSGSCSKLEDISLSKNALGEDGWMAIMRGLRDGGCPNLKRLDISQCKMRGPSATALTDALSSGNCRYIQHLDLLGVFDDPINSLRLLQCIRQGHLPNLRHLKMSSTKLGQEHGRVLGEAIGSRMCPNLEELDVSYNKELGDEGMMPILAGLEAGWCPGLTTLALNCVEIATDGLQALVRALSSGNLSNLERVQFAIDGSLGDEVTAQIIQGLKKCPRLTDMDLWKKAMGEGAGQALLGGLRDNAWPNLKMLSIGQNPDLNNRLVVDGLVEVMERGALPKLEVLNADSTGMTKEGTERLLGCLERGVCPALQKMLLSSQDRNEEEKEWERKFDLRGVSLMFLGSSRGGPLSSLLNLSQGGF